MRFGIERDPCPIRVGVGGRPMLHARDLVKPAQVGMGSGVSRRRADSEDPGIQRDRYNKERFAANSLGTERRGGWRGARTLLRGRLLGQRHRPHIQSFGTHACRRSSLAAKLATRKGRSRSLCQDSSSRGESGLLAGGAAGHRSPSVRVLLGFEGCLHALFQQSEFLDQRVPIKGLDILAHRFAPKLYGEGIQRDQPSKSLGIRIPFADYVEQRF